MKENQRKPLVPQCHKDSKLETLNWHHHHLQQTTKTQLGFLSDYQKTTRQQKKMIKPHFPPTSHCLFGRQEMERKKKTTPQMKQGKRKENGRGLGSAVERESKTKRREEPARFSHSLISLYLTIYLSLSLSLSLSLRSGSLF